ncbi:MAG TPA: amino acid adenylation domain-containing protein, partial [Thermoanaerobaculia bacterium]|nr:amino acid adenylation domain-containing protein [Thermoanaerobaculia bacterium]
MRQQREASSPRPRPGTIPVQPRPARSFPLSFAQERLWFLAQLGPASSDYNIPLALDFRGPLDPADLQASLAEVVRRHEMLRSRFALEEGRPVQIVEPPGDFPLPLVDLAGLGTEIRGEEARRLAAIEARRPFDLAAGHLLRAMLLRLAATEHRLVANMHHIVSDGWSCSVMSREMGQIYRARLSGSTKALPPLAIQYADFAVWQRQILSGAALEQEVEHWRQRLAGLPPVLELPSDRPRPPVRSPRGASLGFELTERASDGLRELARGDGGTLFITLLSGFFALLRRYTDRDDLCVGSPTAGRRLMETEELIGFFVNTLVLRADLSGDLSFREILVRVREVVFDAHAHQDLPFERLVAELAPERSLGHTPLFQVSFTFQNVPPAALDLAGLRVAAVEVETGTAKFDLGLTLGDGAGALRGSLDYSLDLFDAPTIQRMSGHLRTLLEGVAADPARRLSELPLLGPIETQQLVLEWNDTGAWYGVEAGQSLQELISAQALRTPDAVAAVSGDEHLIYRELALRSGSLASQLAAVGVGPDAVVGICAERSLEMIVGLLGILTAGGAYLPLDPSYPQERLSFVLESAGAAAVLVQDHLADRLPPSSLPRLPLATPLPVLPVLPVPLAPTVHTEPENLAYVIYTSGSTGAPKGAMVAHRAIVNRLLWMQEAYGLSPADRVLQKTPFGFDVSVWELFWPLLVGAPLVFARPEGHKDPFYLADLIEEQRVTVLHFVPSMLRAFLEADQRASCVSVRAVMASGEALPFDLTERFHERMCGELHNLYGPTEAAVDVSSWACVPDDSRRIVPIGRPIDNLRLHVVDRSWQPVPCGVPGELMIGGVGLGRGYLGRPDLTAERFVPDPFTAEEGEAGGRLYRTGDLARHLPMGEIEFLGRLDFQVKIRGFRIELGEIEAALLAHPGVREAAVLLRQDRLGEPALVACVVPDGGPIPAEELRGFLRERLPEAMVPSAFVPLEALPLSSNGKLDRKALLQLAPAAPAGEERSGLAGHAAPGTPAEEILAGIWEEVLRRGQVGVRDSFFDLGGHSLLATQVVSRVREAFGVEMPVRELFEAPTVAGFAARIERRREPGESALPEAPPVVPVGRNRDLPLSFAQQRLWFLEKLEPGSAAYNVPLSVRLAGRLEADVLARGLAEVARRHEALRTTFPERDGRPVQAIAPVLAVPLMLVDLSGLPEREREAEALRRVTAEARRPFELASGPLIRGTLLRLAAEDHALLVSMHHIVTDGWSMGIFLRELITLYTALSRGRSGELPELPVQYADFVVWQRSWLAGEVLEAQLAYWRQRLTGAPALLELPTDRPRPLVETHHGAALPLALGPSLSRALVALARREGATPFMVLLAGFAALLGRYSGQDDVVVGSPIAGRNRREIEGLIGFFVNTLALRVELSQGLGFLDLLRQVRQTALEAYAHQDIPFERLVEELVTDRGLGHSPLFQATLTVQNTPPVAVEGAGPELEMRLLGVESASAKFELSLDFALAGEELAGGLEYNTDLFDASTARRLASHFARLLEGALAAPESLLPEILLLAPAERQQLLREWNDTEAAYPAEELCLHELVWRQAERAPDAVAVTLAEEHLSYAELRRRSGWLAHRLRRLGVGPEVPVAIAVERSPEMVVGLLGILQAGGAYVPLDPDYPAERLSYMVEDSAAPLLLTQRHLVERLPESGARVVLLDEAARPEPGLPPEAPSGVLADNLLYVIYTSGSTGRPKGVMVRHRGVVNRLLWAVQDYPITSADRVLQKASFSFDFSVEECFSPLLAGARLVLARPGGQRDSAYLLEAVVEEEITLLHFVPAVLQAFLAEEGLEACHSLRFVFSGADTLTPELRERFEARIPPGVLLRNQYGPTEISIDVTEWVCRPGEGRFVAPIGRPIGNGLAYVVDSRLEPVPMGIAGELLLGGAGLARGYQGRPDLTADRFVPSPWGREAGARLYRTGDRVRLLPDGNLEFLGRVDHQIKIRGYRIEPGEIEAVLATHPAVHEAVVVAREDRKRGRSLLACVVPAAGAVVVPEELRSFMREQLPDYMVPSAFAVLEVLPLGPSGKVDRKALAQLATIAEEHAEDRLPGGGQAAPRTPSEEILAAIFAEVLRRERVGVHDGFFDFGGHSLLATQVVSRARQAFGVELPIRDLFEAPTVAGLAERIERLRRAGAGVEAPPILPVPRQGGLPLSFAQQRLWFLHRLAPDSAVYNV